ncbi:MAG: hypothetical protein K6U12_01965 [Armatimonadetes bacterium]|nr:hypothetical protein [Armatimonadota bacterium]
METRTQAISFDAPTQSEALPQAETPLPDVLTTELGVDLLKRQLTQIREATEHEEQARREAERARFNLD